MWGRLNLREEVSAGGVVFRRSGDSEAFDILLIRDRFGRWTLPKGHLEPGEVEEQAALREVFEETGLNGEIRAALGVTDYTFHDGRGPVHKTVHYFLLEAKGGTLRPQEGEVDEVRWFPSEEVSSLPQYDNNRHILDAAMRLLTPGSKLARSVRPFLVMEVLESAQRMEAEGRSIIHLEVGEPDFPTPEPIREAAKAAIDSGRTLYTPSLGLLELRRAVADSYNEACGLDIDPGRVVITSGTSAALNLILLALLDPGDEVLVSDPGYACYPTFIRAAGGRPVTFPLREADGFRPDPGVVGQAVGAVGGRTRAIMVNSPANPTGVVLSRQDWAGIVGAAGPGTWLISDEIYHGLVYEGECPSALEFTDRAFVIGGFSKLYAMTGWRLGFCIVPPEFIRPIQKLQQNLYICAPSIAQAAALGAMTASRREVDQIVAGMVKEYRQRRDLLLEGLSRLGLGLAPEYRPSGAYYVLVNTSHIDRDSYRLARDILDRAGVALTPGIDFGPGAEGYLRISYAASMASLEEGLSRLGRYLASKVQ